MAARLDLPVPSDPTTDMMKSAPPTPEIQPNRSLELQFPILCLSDPVQSHLDIRSTSSTELSGAMLVPTEPQPEERESSLGDSHYDHITESDFQTSDDEDLDDAAVSVSARGTDGFSSVSDLNEIISTSSQADPQETPSDEDEDEDEDEEEQGELSAASIDESEASYDGASVDSLKPPTVNDSGMTVTNDKHNDSGEPSIEFKEPSSRADPVDVTHTIRDLDDTEARNFLPFRGVPDGQARVSLTVRQTMSKQELVLKEPFRVLFMAEDGRRAHSMARIREKIARSLAVSMIKTQRVASGHTYPTRYNIMPVSGFGGNQSPEVTLIPSSEINLCFEEVVQASRLPFPDPSQCDTQDSYSRQELRLETYEGTTYISRRARQGQDHSLDISRETCKLPHVAIILYGEGRDDRSRKLHSCFSAFMTRHDVPMIKIDEYPFNVGRNLKLIDVESHNLHLCLESPSSLDGSQGIQIHERVPIDSFIFMTIDERQLNRHLAYLVGLRADRKSAGTTIRKLQDTTRRAKLSLGGDVEKLPLLPLGSDEYKGLRGTASVWNQRFTHGWYGPAVGVFLLTLASLWMFLGPLTTVCGLPGSVNTDQRWTAGRSTNNILPSLGRTPMIAGSQTATLTSSSTTIRVESTPVAFAKDPKGLIVASTETDSAGAGVEGATTSEEFKLQIIGCCHVVLKPPRRYTALKKAPKLFVEVRRSDETVDARLTRLFDGVYELALMAEDAYDGLNVTVLTKAKPLLNQTFYLDFGTQWLNVASWKSRARLASQRVQKDLHSAQDNLMTALGQASIDVQTAFNHTKTAALVAQQEAQRLRDLSMQRTEGTRRRMAVHAKALSKEASERGTAWSKELAIRSHAVSTTVSARVLEVYDTNKPLIHSFQSPFSRKWTWPDLPSLRVHKRPDSLTLLTYQKKARGVWEDFVGKIVSHKAGVKKRVAGWQGRKR